MSRHLTTLGKSMSESSPSRENDRSPFLSLAATLILAVAVAGLLFQNARLEARSRDDSQMIKNLSTHLESLSGENSQLREQNDHLQRTLEEYQERVRSYQTEIYQLRRQANISGDNTTTLQRYHTASVIAPAVMAKTYTDIWGEQRVEGYIGVPTNLTLEVVPGRGRVLVSTQPSMGEVFQDTAVTAKETAEGLSGIHLDDYDLIFSIQASDKIPSVDGPSAGAAMTLLVLSLLENKTIKPYVSMTGTISRDGKIGAIGSPVEKAVAAEKAGTRIFCIPKGNEYTMVSYKVPWGPWTIIRQKPEKTKTLIENRTSLQVYLVEDIQGLLDIATYKQT